MNWKGWMFVRVTSKNIFKKLKCSSVNKRIRAPSLVSWKLCPKKSFTLLFESHEKYEIFSVLFYVILWNVK